jgi:hypothetical protein
MTEVTLHPTPRWRDVVLEQVRIVGLSLRTMGLLVAAVLGFGTILIVSELVGGGPGFDSRQTFPTALYSALIPFVMWRNDRPFGPAFLWTLPVDRRRLALARVFAGWLWTMATVGGFILWLYVLALLAHAPALEIVMRVPVTATATAYLFASALILGVRHPLRWLLAATGVFFLIGGLSEAFGSGPSALDSALSASGFVSAVEDAVEAWGVLPGLARWAITTFISLGSGLAALWAAISRHKENR